MARVVLGVTGSVAAVRAPALAATLRAQGHDLRVVATAHALYFFDPTEFGPVLLHRDSDEWPGDGYRRGDPVLHIELRRWAEMLVVAPLDAQTLGKFALGLSDNLLTCLFRAWDFSRPVILAPAMNTLMWESPVTLRHLRQLLSDRATRPVGDAWGLGMAPEVFAREAPGLVLVPPQAKRLACGDLGVGAMAEVTEVAEAVCQWSATVPARELAD